MRGAAALVDQRRLVARRAEGELAAYSVRTVGKWCDQQLPAPHASASKVQQYNRCVHARSLACAQL
jgi:hypothetical protein